MHHGPVAVEVQLQTSQMIIMEGQDTQLGQNAQNCFTYPVNFIMIQSKFLQFVEACKMPSFYYLNFIMVEIKFFQSRQS